MGLRILSRDEIDDDQWNLCVSLSAGTKIYAYTWFLDAVTDRKWKGVVSDSYQAVMPFFLKRKLLIPYVTQPFLCQQLGVFALPGIMPDKNAFYEVLKDGILKIDIMTGSNLPAHILFTEKTNHVLNVNRSYENIRADYSRNTKRNIAAALESGLSIVPLDDAQNLVSFLSLHDPTALVSRNMGKIKKLISTSFKMSAGLAWGAADHEGSLHAVAYFIVERETVYFLLCASDDTGKNAKSMYHLIDHAIHTFAGHKNAFDFTGSSIPNIARRNLGFGASPETYYHVKWKKFF